MRNDDIDWARLDRCVRREGTPEELDALERWVNSDPELRALADIMGVIGRPPGEGAFDWAEPEIWRRIRRRMVWYARESQSAGVAREYGSRWGAVPRSPWYRAFSRGVLAAAASVLFLIVVTSTMWMARSRHEAPRRTPAAPVSMREITARRGERVVLDLGDGSRVTLAAESRLRVPATFDSAFGPRDLYLDGAGFFDVHHDSRRSFRVHTAIGIAEAVGTAFLVTAYPETHGMQVVVASGVVALRRSTESQSVWPPVTLRKGNLAHLDQAGTATTVMDVVNVSTFLAWMHGEIRFSATRFGDVLPVLSRWYGLHVRLADHTLADRRISAVFKDKSSAEVLDAIALLLHLRYERNGESVTLFYRK